MRPAGSAHKFPANILTKGLENKEGEWPAYVDINFVSSGRPWSISRFMVALGLERDGWVTRTSRAFFGDKGKKNYKGKIIESTGLPDIEKVNPDNGPSSDKHGRGTWQEKRWCHCQKSLSTFSGLFSPALHLSRVTEAMPSLKSGQILHVFNAHMPNKQHVAFPSGRVRRVSRNGSLADLSSCCSAYEKTSAGEKTRNRNHFRHLQCRHLYLSQSPQALFSIHGEKYVLLTHRSSKLL